MEEAVFDQLLDDNQRYKLYLYRLIQLYAEQGVTFTILEQQLELSKFKTRQLVTELSAELQVVVSNEQWKGLEFSSDVINGQLTNQTYQQLRLQYFKQSAAGELLLQNFLHGYTISELAALKYISLAQAYKIRKKVNQFLGQWDLAISKTSLVGSEKRVRGFFFQMISYFYNGESVIFEKKVQVKINQMIDRLQFISQRTLSVNQKSQLAIFLGVQYYRVLNDFKLVELDTVTYLESNVQKLLASFLVITLYQTETIINEQNYLMLFLVTLEQFDIAQLANSESLTFPMIVESYMTKYQSAILPFLKTGYLPKRLIEIGLKWEVLMFSTNTFISENQFVYFKQNFPMMHQTVLDFVKATRSIGQRRLFEHERGHLYYDLMFSLLENPAILALEKPVYLAIDFSGGPQYNAFIKANVLVFQYLNIIVEERMTNRTDLYLSDFANATVKTKQIIWKNPPLDDDWQVFADSIIEIKGSR